MRSTATGRSHARVWGGGGSSGGDSGDGVRRGQGSGAVEVYGRREQGVEEGGREGSFQPAVGVRALAVAFHARWSESDIFGPRDCAKWRVQNIICSVDDFSASVGSAKIRLPMIYRRFFGRGAISASVEDVVSALLNHLHMG
jgi:hypothetical protein